MTDARRAAWFLLAVLVLPSLATAAADGVGGPFLPLVVSGATTAALVGRC